MGLKGAPKVCQNDLGIVLVDKNFRFARIPPPVASVSLGWGLAPQGTSFFKGQHVIVATLCSPGFQLDDTLVTLRFYKNAS